MCWFHVDISNIARVDCSRSPWQLALQQNGESFYQKVFSACEISPALRQAPSQTSERLQNDRPPCTSFLYHVKELNWNAIVTDLLLVYKHNAISHLLSNYTQTNKKYVTQIFVRAVIRVVQIRGIFLSKAMKVNVVNREQYVIWYIGFHVYISHNQVQRDFCHVRRKLLKLDNIWAEVF